MCLAQHRDPGLHGAEQFHDGPVDGIRLLRGDQPGQEVAKKLP